MYILYEFTKVKTTCVWYIILLCVRDLVKPRGEVGIGVGLVMVRKSKRERYIEIETEREIRT